MTRFFGLFALLAVHARAQGLETAQAATSSSPTQPKTQGRSLIAKSSERTSNPIAVDTAAVISEIRSPGPQLVIETSASTPSASRQLQAILDPNGVWRTPVCDNGSSFQITFFPATAAIPRSVIYTRFPGGLFCRDDIIEIGSGLVTQGNCNDFLTTNPACALDPTGVRVFSVFGRTTATVGLRSSAGGNFRFRDVTCIAAAGMTCNAPPQLHGCASIGGTHCGGECVNRPYTEVMSGQTQFECTCAEGHELNQDGRSCDEIDECQRRGDDACGRGLVCTNTVGTFTCACPEVPSGAPQILTGTTFSEGQLINTCGYEDVCARAPSPCSHGCTNDRTMAAGHVCSCPTDYVLNINGSTCDKINFCLEADQITPKAGICPANATCRPLDSQTDPRGRTHTCSCNQYYTSVWTYVRDEMHQAVDYVQSCERRDACASWRASGAIPARLGPLTGCSHGCVSDTTIQRDPNNFAFALPSQPLRDMYTCSCPGGLSMAPGNRFQCFA